MAPRRSLLVVVFLSIFTAIVFVARYGLRDSQHLKKVDDWIHSSVGGIGDTIGDTIGGIGSKEKEPKVLSTNPCMEHLGWLEPYQFTYPINYVSRDILTTPSANGERPPLTVVDEPLFDTEFTTVDLAQSQTVNIDKCLPPLTLEVPHGTLQPVDASNMVFGLQTTMKRLKETVKHLERWLPHTNARLYAMVIESEDLAADDADMAALEKEFHSKGMEVTVVHPVRPIDSFAQRYFSLVDVMYEHVNDKTEWVVCIDDDTFFPSMFDLLEMLKKHDHAKPQYIGSLSEDWWAVNHYGLMGFGGAGLFLSVPMAKIIEDHTDECKENLRTTAGDISVMDCVYRFSSTKLTHIPALHQIDISGDLSGFYESGREMLSVHHWKEGSAAGYKLEMEKMHLVANICDSCFLQRWQFPNEMVLSNGFSIAHYPEGHLTGKKPGGVLGTGVGGTVEKIKLEEMEHTWADDLNVLHSLAPVRDKMPDEFKIGYKLLDSMIVDSDAENGREGDVVRQIYFKEEAEGVNDTVMVLNWHTAPKDEL
ncbi:hypothetical protein LSUE1_G009460 [Lachnellula suecica]|uniref:Glycosyltransferase family 31 protein n=1 Tax=Lachnellula suecica TaxID=602035 RepID=A0A8T9BZ37_9HELO|nr:hypothetical protein LSUE1_G009460 [Lachnellula suecica]